MKQPFAVNLIYTIGVFTNSYKILNEMNTLVHKQFKSLEKYIFPNGFAIPMELNSVSDESEYTIDDRKYYSQTYQIKVMAFIITKNDYVVTKIPSRVRMPFVGGMNSRRKKEQEETFELDSLSTENIKQKIENCEVVVEIRQNPQTSYKDIMTEPEAKISLEMEELTGKQVCWKDTEDELYVNRKIVYNATVDYCDMKVLHGVIEFKSDYNLMLESIEMRNIATFKFFINDMAKKSGLDGRTIMRELKDFVDLFNECVADKVISQFEKSSLLMQAEAACISEATVMKLLKPYRIR